MFYRLRFRLAQAVAFAICEPQLRLGRRRHDGHCDECGHAIGKYAGEKLDFPLERHEIDDPYATSKWEKLRAMFNAEYVRVCLECSVELEDAESENSSGSEGGDRR